MPARQRGSAYRLSDGRWGIQYREGGRRRRESPFPSKTAALDHYRDVVEPRLLGKPAPPPELTLAELAGRFLERHAAVRSERTMRSLRERLARPLAAYGDVPLRELERMSGELADFAAALPPRFRYSVMSALRQTLAAGVRWGHLRTNPAKDAGPNPQPSPRPIRAFTADELALLDDELNEYGPLVPFAAATGLRPAEWARLERRDVDRARRLLTVRGTKTQASRREVPLTSTALAALARLPARLDSPYVFAGPRGRPLHLDNFRRRVWAPAVEAAAIATPARLYDLRSTFATNALARGLTLHELARVMGTSARMVELHYGALVEGAHDALLARLEAPERAEREARP
jgi:integrase